MIRVISRKLQSGDEVLGILRRGLRSKELLSIVKWQWRLSDLDESSRGLVHNYEKDDKWEECNEEDMGPVEAKEFRGMTARMNFLGQDSADLQYSVK